MSLSRREVVNTPLLTYRIAMMNQTTPPPHDRPAVDLSLLLIRITVGGIFAAHGAQKMFGLFDGPGLSNMVKMMGPLAYPVSVGEFFGGIGLIFGFLTRF